MISIERIDDVWVLDFGEGDNRFNKTTVDLLNACLDQTEGTEGPTALVTTATGKIWHNGLDLAFMGGLDGDGLIEFIGGVQRTMSRLLTLPMPTVAAVGGHAFAGGGMYALAHDVRIMREDRGYFCLPEVDLGMTFTEGMTALIAAKLGQPALHRAAVLGTRIGGPEALALGIVEATAPDGAVLDAALERAGQLASKAGESIVGIRRNFYADAIEALST